jgi:hypothetical protein
MEFLLFETQDGTGRLLAFPPSRDGHARSSRRRVGDSIIRMRTGGKRGAREFHGRAVLADP